MVVVVLDTIGGFGAHTGAITWDGGAPYLNHSSLKSWKKTCVECDKKITCSTPCGAIKRRLKGMEPVKHIQFDRQGNIIKEETITGTTLKARPYRRQNQATFRVKANKAFNDLAYAPKSIRAHTSEADKGEAIQDLKKKLKIEVSPRGILYYHIVEHLKARRDKPFIKFPRKEVPVFYDQENYYLLDIYFTDRRIAVEVDGKAYHNGAYDERRDKRLQVLGITTWRYPAKEVINDYKGIAASIIRRIHGLADNMP